MCGFFKTILFKIKIRDATVGNIGKNPSIDANKGKKKKYNRETPYRFGLFAERPVTTAMCLGNVVCTTTCCFFTAAAVPWYFKVK